MNKIWLIIKREYLSRVKKKSFLYVTFGVPLLFIGMMSLVIFLAVNQGDKKKIRVVDESGWFKTTLKNSKKMEYSFAEGFAANKEAFVKDGYDYLVYIPANLNNIQMFAEKTPGAMDKSVVEDEINSIIHSRRLAEAHIDSGILANAMKSVSISTTSISEKGEKKTQVVVAQVVGLLGAILIYLTLFLYGVQVMKGVIEEKTSRIIEVVISSVKPFQLMMGKIVGVGMVGLTQFLLWIGSTAILGYTLIPMLTGNNAEKMAEAQQAAATHATNSGDIGSIGELFQSMDGLPVLTIIFGFIFYFLFGYLLYSALFAAVGSAVDNETETQQFMIPITLPLLFTIYVSQFVIINNPHSNIAVWLSMIPFTAPIAMMVRLPYHVPPLQIAGSMALMVAGFIFTTWVAGRIYRTGVLMYGKKASYKEIIKWFKYRD